MLESQSLENQKLQKQISDFNIAQAKAVEDKAKTDLEAKGAYELLTAQAEAERVALVEERRVAAFDIEVAKLGAKEGIRKDEYLGLFTKSSVEYKDGGWLGAGLGHFRGRCARDT